VRSSGRADGAKVAWEYLIVALERNVVRTVGVITSGLVAVGVLMATAVALKSIPDFRQYRRIRDM